MISVRVRWPSLALLAACASSRPPAGTGPDYRPVPTSAAPPRATLYADCLADAIANKRYAKAGDEDTDVLVFTCTGAPARAFFDGLAAWSAQIGSEFQSGGQTYRSTARVQRDLFGVDYCSADACVVTLNAGAFVR
ncbi:MAG: hypothetical protein JWP01_2564 [Myxococcales bacterium]|nr:hypothetical protein [Myxococcales bacterium]